MNTGIPHPSDTRPSDRLTVRIDARGHVAASVVAAEVTRRSRDGQSGSDHPRRFPGQKINKPTVIKREGVGVRIYKTREYKRRRWYHSHTIVWHDAAGLHRQKEDDFTAAKQKAETLCKEILAGHATLATFSHADKACLSRCQEILAAAGITTPLEVLVGEYAESRKILGGSAMDSKRSLVEVAKFFVRHQPASGSRPAPQIYKAMLLARQSDGNSKNTVDDIRSRVGRFVKTFTGPLTAVTGADINKWLHQLTEVHQGKVTERPLSRRTRNNYRGNLIDFYNYARESGDIPKEWNPIESVPKAKNETVRIEIFTPDEGVELLGARVRYEKTRGRRVRSMIPFLGCSFFAGLRHEEMCSPGQPVLDWSDIDFERMEILVRKEVARKIGCDRIVPLQPNLAEWLKPYERSNGSICEYSNANNELQLTAALAKRKWKDNGGRKSFISYRQAITKNIGQVADEAGTSPDRIRHNYKKLVPRREADRWFNISPSHAQVLQLRFRGL